MKIFSNIRESVVLLSFLALILCGSTAVSAQKLTNLGADFTVESSEGASTGAEMRLDLTAQIADAPPPTAKPVDFAYRFDKTNTTATPAALENSFAADEWTANEYNFGDAPRVVKTDAPNDDVPLAAQKFQWKAAITQSLVFLAVQHGYAIGFQQKTRDALKHGAFWKDYGNSVKSLRGWDDGGRFFTNYIAHPMQGALTGHIYVQNSPRERLLQFGKSGDYWRSRMKAFLWTTAWSTQFEIGPISQASIGNVGLKGKQTWEDIIVTPTMGTAMLVAEDALDRYIIRRFDNKNIYVKVFVRMLLNPTRNFSNMLRLKEPWYRDR